MTEHMPAMNNPVYADPGWIPPEAADLYLECEHLGPASKFTDEIFQIIEHIPLFGDMSRAEVECLCRYMRCYGAPSRANLLHEGDEGHHLLIVLTGRVNVIKGTPQGITLVAAAGIGTTLGEMSMIDGANRFASCIATEPTDFAVLTRPGLSEILLDHPRLGNKLLLVLLQLMTRRLRDASSRLLPHIAGIAV
jgi:CRP-like cAMP-binding protein